MDIDLADAIEYANTAIEDTTGHSLKAPEIIILKGTWRGLTYGQMSEESTYSTNYLMRDVAPKLWRQLSGAFGRPIGKTNFRVVLENYAETNLPTAKVEIDEAVANLADTEFPPRSGADPSSKLSRLSKLYGYETELTRISQWLSGSQEISYQGSASQGPASQGSVSQKPTSQEIARSAQGHLIGIWGLNGVGKSLLCEAAVAEVENSFEAVVWRSLKQKPLLNDFCTNILTELGIRNTPSPAPSISVPSNPALAEAAYAQSLQSAIANTQPVEQLRSLMAQRRILLIIEGVESILQPKALAGDYQPAYQPYSDFFQATASTASSIILTGTEGPADWINPGDRHSKQHSIYLTGLDETAATALLEDESLASPDAWPELISRYQGHPLALQSAARVIRDLFNGRVDAFLQHASVLFADIIRLLSPSFDRLSELELTILYWLASQKGPLSLADIQQTLPSLISPTELISALDSLKQRAYLAVQSQAIPPVFQLPPLVEAYTVHRLMAQFQSDAQPASASPRPAFSYPSAERVITLSKPAAQPIQLNQWVQGRFESDWHSLSQLFEAGAIPSTRLRNAYHLRDETFIKRYKSVSLGVLYKNAQSEYGQAKPNQLEGQLSKQGQPTATSAVLVVAIRQKAEDLCEVCVQAQPDRGADALPVALELKLLDAQQHLLASVQAEQADSFIQLPYFQGQPSEPFSIEMAVGELRHTETFLL